MMRTPTRTLYFTAAFLSCTSLTIAQVANNNFAQAPDVYTSIDETAPGGTVLFGQGGGVFDDGVVGPIVIPPFDFDGTIFTEMWVSTNGYVTFGSAPAADNYNPISSNAPYLGAIVPFGFDLQNTAAGPASNRRIVMRISGNEVQIEWRRVRRKGLDEEFSFQLRLNTDFDGMRIVYGPIVSANSPGPATSETAFPEVGLRGPNNNHANNVKNRRVTVIGNNNWNNSLPGNANTSVSRFTGGNDARYWVVGQTYYFNGIWNCTVGTPCNDGDPCTSNDTTLENCYCVGTYDDQDNDGTCDFYDLCEGPEPGMPCDDGDPCTINDTVDTTCDCIGTYQDSDNDGVCDAFDNCPLDPAKTEPGLCGCGNKEPGSTCNDGNANTENDVIGSNCLCAGTPINNCVVTSPSGPLSESIVVEINTDLSGHQITWQVQDPLVPSTVYCAGGPYIQNTQVNITQVCTLAQGCYVFVLLDSGGDGMLSGFNGGYTIREAGTDGRRIIDNRNNGDFGSMSKITGEQCYSFCLPVGTDRLIYTSCDKFWWRSNEYIVASSNPLVAAEWITGGANSVQSSTSGYEFWFYNPNGGYSFRKFRPHNVSDGFGNVGASRACHLRINNWSSALHIPEHILMNVKVRGRINGDNLDWGPACRFVRDEALALCPPTKLMDIPGNQFLSCGQFRQFVSTQRIHARPISGATQYQWRFRQPGEGVTILRTSSTYYLNLGWSSSVAAPLQANQVYEVDVRAVVNGVACGSEDPWGDICLLTISSQIQGGGVNMALDHEQPAATMSLWPNPSNGADLNLRVQDVAAGIQFIQVDLFDLTGKILVTRTIPVQDGRVESPLALDASLAGGLYLMRAMVGDSVYTERIVIRN